MNWTKIPTNLLISRIPDNELIAIVKYQLLWADLEYQPTDEIALRYMTNKQVSLAKHYLNDLEAQVVADINSTVKHRGGQKTYYKKKQSLTQNTDGQYDGQCDNQYDGQADRADKIREEIKENINKRKFTIDSIITVSGQYFDEFPVECMSVLREHWTDDKIESIRKDLTSLPDHETTVRQLLEKYPENKSKPKQSRFVKPTLEEVEAYCEERQNGIDAVAFYSFYESKGWQIGKNQMKNWKAAIITWERKNYEKPLKQQII